MIKTIMNVVTPIKPDPFFPLPPEKKDERIPVPPSDIVPEPIELPPEDEPQIPIDENPKEPQDILVMVWVENRLHDLVALPLADA